MKKSKLFSSAFLACGLTSIIAPIITSCGNQSINLIIEQETKDQFQGITSNCALNKESTINFIPKQDQELDSSSVEIRINGTKLEYIKDYKIVDNAVTIYYYAMTSTNVNVKANAKVQHILDKFDYSFYNKPLCANDTMMASDLNVTFTYKDGTVESIPYGDDGYKIYQITRISQQEYKTEVLFFDKKPFEFTKTGRFTFQIEYVKSTNIDPIRFDLQIVNFGTNQFIQKYSEAFENCKATINKYGWMSFDGPAKVQEIEVYSALVKYDDKEIPHCIGDFRNKNEWSVDTVVVGGKTVQEMQEYMEEHVPSSFENYSDSFAFKTITQSTGEYIYLRFNKQGYLVEYIDTHDDKQMHITNMTYINYVKTARVITNIPDAISDLISTMGIYDPVNPSNKKSYINEKDNKFIVRTVPKEALGDNIAYGKYGLYSEDGTKIFTSDVIELTKVSTDTVIEVDDWTAITHGGKLTLKFDPIKYASVELSTTHTYTNSVVENVTWKDPRNKYAYDGKGGGVDFSFTTKSEAASKSGSWYLSIEDGNLNPDKVVAKGICKNWGEGGSTTLTDVDWSKISVIPAGTGTKLYLMIGEPKTATLTSGVSITNSFDDVSYSSALTESEEGTQVEITLTPKKSAT